MSTTPTSRNPWRWIAITAILALVAAGGWIAGARFGQPGAAQAAAGFDIGVADTPRPTGQVREFQLVAKEVPWEIAPGITVSAITYNGQVPGPLIRVTEGDTLRVTIKNELSKDTAIHWHGLHVPNSMDGVPPLTQPAIKPGETFTYEFTASHAGTFMYHSHQNAVEQIDRGLYGPIIIDPANQPPARFDKEFTMMLSAWDTTAGQATQHAMHGSGGMAGSGSAANDRERAGEIHPEHI